MQNADRGRNEERFGGDWRGESRVPPGVGGMDRRNFREFGKRIRSEGQSASVVPAAALQACPRVASRVTTVRLTGTEAESDGRWEAQ